MNGYCDVCFLTPGCSACSWCKYANIEEEPKVKGNELIWHPGTEFPKEDGEYLVTCSYNGGEVRYVETWTFANDLSGYVWREEGPGWCEYYDNDYFSRNAPIAWMPMPKPYEG